MAIVEALHSDTGGNVVLKTGSNGVDQSDCGTSFLYKKFNNPIMTVNNEEHNIWITDIANTNLYYFAGLNTCVTINNARLAGSDWAFLTNSAYAKARKLNQLLKPKIANCVGWAHGRVKELWGRAMDMGYIKKNEEGTWYIPSRNDQTIEGSVYIPLKSSGGHMPACNAGKFYSKWSTKTGWSKSEEYPKRSNTSVQPKIGAVLCWTNNSAGHVAVVEGVYNLGQSDEYVIISQSGYSKTGAKNLVWTAKIMRYQSGTDEIYYKKGYSFRGFLYSPVCQFVPTTANYISIEKDFEGEFVEEEQNAYDKAAKEVSGNTFVENLKVGDQVEVYWIGNTKPDGSGDRINLIGGYGKIKKVCENKIYKYGVGFGENEEIKAYYDRAGLRYIEEE